MTGPAPGFARASGLGVLAWLSGCGDDLLPGELVLGVEVPATVTYGDAESRFGAALAWNGVALAVAAPGAGEVTVGADTSGGPANLVAWVGTELVRVGAGAATVGEADAPELAGAAAIVAFDDALYFGDDSGVGRLGGWRVSLPGVRAVAADDERVLVLACAETCQVAALSTDSGAPLELEEALGGGEGGAVSLAAGLACAGDPDLDDPDGAGRVSCEGGLQVEGAPGEHLGQAIGAGYAAGTFDKWIVPPRARIVPLAGGGIFVLESGAENQPLVLAGDEGHLFVGDPFHPHAGLPSGAVFAVEL